MAKQNINIALANIRIYETNIRASYQEDKHPNLSDRRLTELHRLLNEVRFQKCDLFVLPEFAVPHDWLPEVAAWSRKNQIGIVCGLEHLVCEGDAYNLLATILPYKDEYGFKHCYVSLRKKNHYAPEEIEKLSESHRNIPEMDTVYDRFDWRGIQFAPYLCYELADINHRGLFMSEIDFLIACVFNKDTKYFADIVDSLTRDVHCYVVQANSSHYGDSCVLQPTKSVTHDIIRVRGGENSTILTAKISVAKLREFQILKLSSTENKKHDFKPTPPSFDYSKVLERSQ